MAGSVFHWLRYLRGLARRYLARRVTRGPSARRRRSQRPLGRQAKERLFRRLLAGRDRRRGREVVAHLRDRPLRRRTAATGARPPELAPATGSRRRHRLGVAADLRGRREPSCCDADRRARHAPRRRRRADSSTGSYLGKNCRGNEKLRRLDEWIAQRHYPTAPDALRLRQLARRPADAARRDVPLQRRASRALRRAATLPAAEARLRRGGRLLLTNRGAELDEAALATVVGDLNRGRLFAPRDDRVARADRRCRR